MWVFVVLRVARFRFIYRDECEWGERVSHAESWAPYSHHYTQPVDIFVRPQTDANLCIIAVLVNKIRVLMISGRYTCLATFSFGLYTKYILYIAYKFAEWWTNYSNGGGGGLFVPSCCVLVCVNISVDTFQRCVCVYTRKYVNCLSRHFVCSHQQVCKICFASPCARTLTNSIQLL